MGAHAGRENLLMITDLRGPYRWLSNFHAMDIVFEGETYASSEHAYQAAKVPPEARAPFREPTLTCPGVKQLGGTVPLSEDWEDVKLGIMETILRDRFSRHDELQRLLLATGDEVLVEGNAWCDRFWGVSPPPPDGTGENHLGRLLMQIRGELRKTTS